MHVHDLRLVLTSTIAALGCADRPEPPPATDGAACAIRHFVCQRHGEAPLLDGSDPLWTYCHRREPIPSIETRYGGGAAEVFWTYADDGGIERVELQCVDRGPIFLAPERDEMGRVIRWDESGGWTATTELTYDDAGAIAASTLNIEQFEVVTTLVYEDEGRLATRRSELWYQGRLEDSSSVALRYDGADLVGMDVAKDSCSWDVRFAHEAGRLVEISDEGVCNGVPKSGVSERKHEWSGDQLVRSTWIYERYWHEDWLEWEEELRYRYEDGRLVEVQRDRDGEPYATYWYDYDEAGRPVHLLWWGHVETPRALPPL